MGGADPQQHGGAERSPSARCWAAPVARQPGAPALGAVASIAGLVLLVCLPLIAAAGGCTSMGFDHPALRDSMDFGAPQEVRMCVYLDDGVAPEEASQLLDSWSEQAAIYKLYIKPVSFEHMTREGVFHGQILEQVNRIPLGSSCDRILYFVNRNLADFAYGLASMTAGLPEVLGEVDDPTLTHGFVVARIATVNQMFMTPAAVTQHELFHMFGCPRHFDMPDCYRRIQSLKRVEAKLSARRYYDEQGETPFYPTFASMTDSMLLLRAQVDGYPEEQSDHSAAVAAR